MARSTKREKIMLLSTGKNKAGQLTKYSYTTYKNKQNTTDKIEIMKFDPKAWNETAGRLGSHVKFKEKKVPK